MIHFKDRLVAILVNYSLISNYGWIVSTNLIVLWGLLHQWAPSKRLVVYFIGETQASFIEVLFQCKVIFLQCRAF